MDSTNEATNGELIPMRPQEKSVFEAQSHLKDFRAVYRDDNLLFRRIYDTMRLKANDTCLCGNPISKFYEKKGRYKYRCKMCRRTVSPLSQTPLKGLRVPLSVVFEAIYLNHEGRHGLTSAELARYHNLNYNTALMLKRRIQIWMGLVVQRFVFVNTTVECDETYVRVPTGLPGIKHNPGLGSQRVKPVVSLVENGGNERAKVFVVDHVDQPTMKKIFEENVDPSCTVMTDGNPVYRFLSSKGYLHFECNHKEKIYSKNGVHVNTCESLHGLLKSKIMHVHRGISEEYLRNYSEEITFTFIHRNRNVFDAINSLFEALPPLNKQLTIQPNKNYIK